MTALVIISAAPYGTDRPYNALRLAAALQAKGRVRVFLINDGVSTALAGQASPDADQNLAKRLADLLAAGAEVKLCGLCAETRGLHHTELVAGVQVSSMPELADWVADSDRIVTF